MINKEICFFCGSEVEVSTNIDKLGRDVICPVCGHYFITGFSSEHYEQLINKSKYEEQKALLRYYLKRNTMNKSQYDWFEATQTWVENILKNKTLPNIIEQMENLILYCGNKFKQGEFFERNKELVSIVGSESITALDIIIGALLERNLLKQAYGKINIYSFTFGGWIEYEKLKIGKTNSNKAFLAMQFESEFITDDLINKMKNSLEKIGYQLESLQDRQQAGLIDDHLRQRIKSSKFLIVDLSDTNNGAYWEGGYGEGLGKPVIYICDKGQFDKNKSHFDTNHHLTVMYDKNCEDEKNEFHINNFFKKLQDVIKESL
ncbi:hypothetical protein [Candidatus Ruminimicrobiellum ovillum]|uniref:hypothetical protein n=1 Tax=Candidatus Ruminimicrobiellum ovillum TaxID=1947927 RepID=UPI00355AB0E4